MIPDPCPRCGHTTHPTHAVGRFQPDGPTAYRDHADPGAPLRATRAEAEADVCRRWQEAARHLPGRSKAAIRSRRRKLTLAGVDVAPATYPKKGQK